MKRIRDDDFEYIINKYHDASADFDGFARFIRRDEIFSPESGMAPDDIIAGIWENDEFYRTMPNSIRKARALEYVLKNTRISCDERDVFPAVNMMDRPLFETLIDSFKSEIYRERIPKTEARRRQLVKDGIAIVLPDYDHSAPVWDRLFELGAVGILEESERRRKERALTE